jgi:4-amino-4-deoxy-L-arabinose transferase-like glycosyltransferase
MSVLRDKRFWFFMGLGALFFIPFLGGVHLFDWDEVNFAEISREMILLDEFLRPHINFEPFWEKPPLYFWLQVVSMKIFGVNEFAARFPNALCGILTLGILFAMGKKLFNARFGMWWALAYFGSILPHLYFKSGIIDPWFNLFTFGGFYLLILFFWKKQKLEGIEINFNKWWLLFLAGFIVGFSILTKGQASLIVICFALFVYWVSVRFRWYINVPQFLFFVLAASLVTLAWYGIETAKNGTWFIVEFNKYQYRLFSTPDAGHQGFPGYHFIVLLIGCFPASIFALRAIFKFPKSQRAFHNDFRKWMIILLVCILVLFSIVQSKIVHYSSLAYFPLTYLAALAIYQWDQKKIRLSPGMKWGLGAIGGVFVAATIALPILMQNPEWLQTKMADPFAAANLDAPVHWTGWEIIPGVFLLGILITFFILHKRKSSHSAIVLFGGTAVFVMLTLVFFIGRIEGYSQRTAINFFKDKAGQDCYVANYGYKSYAQLFYFDKPPVTNEQSYDLDWLLKGDIDKPVYIITKIHKADQLDKYALELVESKNGFVMFKRLPSAR